ncbi:hypothetical protein CVV38_01105 [Candidatus Peregrinibacteria bacterium HGW-Peregrinibacteria-1]|jgi:hypothetical protein|nr:MAG: hypothetical protein CVV38_01105 [Candidatus Peregrinibacteria bacterium HGW-Peregrinibacteria-1]
MQFKSVESLWDSKKISKKSLEKEMKLDFKGNLLVAVMLDHATNGSQGGDITDLIEGAKSIGINVVVLMSPDSADSLPSKNILLYNEKNRLKLIEASDAALVFAFTDIEELILNGVVPIGLREKGIEDYNPNKETGNGFCYDENDIWSLFAAVVRAKETFRFPFDWKHLIYNSLRKLETS